MKVFTLLKIKISPALSRVMSILGVTMIVGINAAIFISNYSANHSRSLTVAQQYFQHAVNEHNVDQSPFSLPGISWKPAPIKDFASGIPANAPPVGAAILLILLSLVTLTSIASRFITGEEIRNDLIPLSVILPPPKY